MPLADLDTKFFPGSIDSARGVPILEFLKNNYLSIGYGGDGRSLGVSASQHGNLIPAIHEGYGSYLPKIWVATEGS